MKEVQALTVSNPGSGSVMLSLNGASASVPWNATASAVQQAIESLFDVQCSVTQDPSSLIFGISNVELLRSVFSC